MTTVALPLSCVSVKKVSSLFAKMAWEDALMLMSVLQRMLAPKILAALTRSALSIVNALKVSLCDY